MYNSKIFLLLLTFLLNAAYGIAQDIENLILKKKEPTCEYISEATSEFFARQIVSENLDSAKIALDYWEGKCGLTEPVLRANVLISILYKESLDPLMDDEFMWFLYNYMNRISYDNEQRFNYYGIGSYYGFVTPNGYFDNVLTGKFNELSNTMPTGTDEYILTNFYSGKILSFFKEIQKPDYTNSQLSKLYYIEVEEVKEMGEGHFGWITGLWVPTGELKTMGSHPDIGLLAGWKKGPWNYDFIMTFKFLKAKNSYEARRKSSNTIETTDHFFGGLIGLEIGRDIYARGPHEFQFIGGLAMDGIDVLEEDESQGLDAQSIISYNLNIGLGYRMYTNGKFYVGLRAKYNVIDYTINNVIDLTGNAFTLQFVVGNVNNIFKSGRLKELEQTIRQ